MRHARKELKYLWGNLARILECFKLCVRGWREGDRDELGGAVFWWSVSFRNNMWPISVIALNTATHIPFFPCSRYLSRKLDNFFMWRKCFLWEEMWVVCVCFFFFFQILGEMKNSKEEKKKTWGGTDWRVALSVVVHLPVPHARKWHKQRRRY